MPDRWWPVFGVCTAALLAGTLLGGCSKAGYKVVPVSGKVTLDGKPVPNLTVTFQPVAADSSAGPRPAAVGSTNDQGEYELTVPDPSGPKKGALVGKHRVAFTRSVPSTGPSSDLGVRMTPDPVLDPVLARYQRAPFEVEVPAAGTKLMNFELRQP
jgi:hypothetical protein